MAGAGATGHHNTATIQHIPAPSPDPLLTQIGDNLKTKIEFCISWVWVILLRSLLKFSQKNGAYMKLLPIIWMWSMVTDCHRTKRKRVCIRQINARKIGKLLN